MLLTDLLPSWKLALDAANKSPKTIISYLDSAKRLEAYLAAESLPLEPEGIRAFLVAERDRTSPASAAKYYFREGDGCIGTGGHDKAHFGDSGIRIMLRRRGAEAGVQNCHPHRFRHTFADSWLTAGGNVDDLMNVAGWKSIAMPLRYAKGRGVARAAEAHKRLSPGDRP